MVWRFEPGTDRGLIVVVDATVSGIRTAEIPSYYVGALILQGAFAALPNDFVAPGYTRDSVNTNLLHKENPALQAQGIQDPGLERGANIVVLGYGFQATPWMLLHPNVQYIGNPGAFSFKRVPDAWVFGFQPSLYSDRMSARRLLIQRLDSQGQCHGRHERQHPRSRPVCIALRCGARAADGHTR
jgi:porin